MVFNTKMLGVLKKATDHHSSVECQTLIFSPEFNNTVSYITLHALCQCMLNSILQNIIN